MFSLICDWINDWVNSGVVGDLRRHRAHYDVTVMSCVCVMFGAVDYSSYLSVIWQWGEYLFINICVACAEGAITIQASYMLKVKYSRRHYNASVNKQAPLVLVQVHITKSHRRDFRQFRLESGCGVKLYIALQTLGVARRQQKLADHLLSSVLLFHLLCTLPLCDTSSN